MEASSQFCVAIRKNGLRMTRQRKLILDILGRSQEHLDAERLHHLAKQRDPQIGLATVYRTLGLLKEFGLVNEHSLGEEHGHFETIPETPHHHFTCLMCRKVIEFEVPFIEGFIDSLVADENLSITRVHLSFEGFCSNCAGKPGAK